MRTLPSLAPSVLLGSSRHGALPPPLDACGVTFHVKARTGLWQLIRALGVRESDVVLVPSYNCGAELDAVLNAPATARFYRVDGSARIDLEDLRRAIEPRTRAVLVTHYFGFPQPQLAEIADLCREHGLFLIEDCAHALYSAHLGRPLGTFGAAAVFSLWKTLPMPHGAAVVANSPLHVGGGTDAPPLSVSLTPLRSSLEGHAFLRYGRAGWAAASLSSHLAQLMSRGLDSGPNSHITFDRSTANWSISPTSRRIAYRSPHAQIAPRRRENYTFLADELAGLDAASPLYTTLPKGTCPLWLPLVVDEPESLVRELARHRIGSEAFWCEFHPAFPADEFPESTYLKTHVVALPIHQDLDAHLLEHVVDVVRAWARTR